MKKYRREIALVALFVAIVAVLILFETDLFALLPDSTANTLLKESLSRSIASALLVPVLVLAGCKRAFTGRAPKFWRALLWCLPCLLVAVVNFPVHALAVGSARVERVDLLWLFAIKCVSIGLMEEFLFRGLLQNLLLDVMQKQGALWAVAFNSALFGLWHLFNLFAGASVGATLLQVGYTFLIGAMFSAVMLRTGNVWICVVLHALFDFGGKIVTDLGTGAFQDGVFWILTAVAGIVCLLHVVFYLVKLQRRGA